LARYLLWDGEQFQRQFKPSVEHKENCNPNS